MDYTLEKIKSLLSQRHGAQRDLVARLGVSKQTVSNWVNGRAKSYNDYLPQIAEFFGISIAELVPPSKNPQIQLADLSSDELAMLKAFREADPALQRAALSVLKSGEGK